MKKLLFSILFFGSTTVFAAKNIEIVSMTKYDTYFEVNVTMRFNIPASLKDSLGATLPNAAAIMAVYGYSIDSIWVTYAETVSFLPGTLVQFKNSLINEWTRINTKLKAITPKPYEKLIGAYWDGNNWIQ